ncbi:Hypothetical predicted protein [Mytilus galloprovincialis]|uniref:Uncharacterized protein n=1 Tax=Mytilus galloprovincialis TaxID=29158 RepID=A0A8B6DWA3_MYTGA|nr:Hypothetical predicted protein [Mytilus galloprovincialis]
MKLILNGNMFVMVSLLESGLSSDKWTRDALDQKVLKVLQLHKDTPSILVLNKVDAMKKKVMLIPITRQLTRGVVGGTNIQITGSQLKRERQQEFNAKNFFQKIQDKVVASDGNLDISAYLEDKKKVVQKEEEVSLGKVLVIKHQLFHSNRGRRRHLKTKQI